MADDRVRFDVPAFTATLDQSALYQNPRSEEDKEVVVSVRFNYPVDAAQFEKRVALMLKSGNDQ